MVASREQALSNVAMSPLGIRVRLLTRLLCGMAMSARPASKKLLPLSAKNFDGNNSPLQETA